MRNVDAAGLGIGDDHPPRIMGVLNVSSESPYDPSVYDDPGEAAEYVDEELIGEGADIVDVGLESANKDLDVLSADQELDRLDTAIETLDSTSGDAVWSIETRYHEVADEALARGFDMVNDICGFADPEMPRVCREHDVAVSKMASPADLERPGAIEAVDDIYDALARDERLHGQDDPRSGVRRLVRGENPRGRPRDVSPTARVPRLRPTPPRLDQPQELPSDGRRPEH